MELVVQRHLLEPGTLVICEQLFSADGLVLKQKRSELCVTIIDGMFFWVRKGVDHYVFEQVEGGFYYKVLFEGQVFYCHWLSVEKVT